MRPKTKRRLILISVFVLLIGGIAAGALLLRQHQLDSQLTKLRDDGMAAFKQNDYIATLGFLKQYVGKKKEDAEALYAYAKARSSVTEPTGKFVSEGINAYRRYLTMRPGDDVARHELVDLYYRSGGYNTEAIAAANDLLAKDPKDPAALRAKAVALFRNNKFAEALPPATEYNALKPTDLKGVVLIFSIMLKQDRKPEAFTAWADAYRKAYPDDPRSDVVEAYANFAGFDLKRQKEYLEKARDALLRAASKDAPDPEYVTAVTEKLDQLQQFSASLDLLRRATKKSNDPAMVQLLVQRLWQNGQFSQVEDLLKELSATDNKSNTNLLAYKAMSLCSLKKTDEAKPIIDALAARSDDSAAVAWSIALETRFIDQPNPRVAIDQYMSAVTRDKENMVIAYLMGDAYAALGENQFAIEYWRQASKRFPSWGAPRVRMAQVLGNTGRIGSAFAEAETAYSQAPSLATAINLATAWFRQIEESGDTSKLNDLLTFVSDKIQSKYPGEEQTLPIYTALLVKSARIDEAKPAIKPEDKKTNDESAKKKIDLAKASIQQVIDAPEDRKIGEETLMRLITVSRMGSLGLDGALTERYEKLHGVTPRLALGRAGALYGAGKPDEALDYLNKAAEAGGHTVQWDAAVAQYLEATRSPSAKDAWIKLADANPNDLAIQNAALGAPSTWQDRVFSERTIERVRKLTGDEGITWKIAKARWLLGSKNKERDANEAVVLLSDIVRSSGDPKDEGVASTVPAEARLLLAAGMEGTGNSAGSLEQYRKAYRENPYNVAIGVRLVERLQAAGKFDEARELLNQFAMRPLNLDQRAQVAAFFARQGMAAKGTSVLEESVGQVNSAIPETILAEIYRRRGRHDKAGEIYEKQLAQPSVPPAVLISAADFYAVKGDQAKVDQILARLNETKAEPGEREQMLGTFYDLYGPREKAQEQFIAATKAAPANEKTWQSLLGFYLRTQRYDELIAASADAAKALPGAAFVETLRRTAEVFKASEDRADVAVLTEAIASEPTSPAIRETLDTIEDLRRNKLPPDQAITRLKLLADHQPNFLPAQIMLVDAYTKAGRLNDATSVASRVAEAFPAAPKASQLAVNAYALAGQNEEMLREAKRWRERSLEHTELADLAICEANLRLNRPQQAVKAFEDYPDFAEKLKSNPDTYANLLAAYCRALVAAGRGDDAAAILLPLAQKSAPWRGFWLAPAIKHKDFASAKSWLEKVTPLLAATPQEQIPLAQAWYNAAVLYRSKEGFEKTRDTIKPLLGDDKLKPEAIQLYGAACEQVGDLASAETGYRRALQLNPNLPAAQNNLAMVLLAKGGDLTEARDLAKKATASPNAQGTYFETLARILLKSNDRAGALDAFNQAIQRDPKGIEAMIGKANLLAQDGKPDKAMLQQIESMLTDDSALSPALKTELENVRTAIKAAKNEKAAAQ